MHQDNRVLTRRGARELTVEETERTNGGFRIHTEAPCTFYNGVLDGPAADGC